MNILILDANYDNFLRSFYSRHSVVKSSDFEAHRALLMAQHFGTSDAYLRSMEKIGILCAFWSSISTTLNSCAMRNTFGTGGEGLWRLVGY
jgi:hypothetical protein